VLTRKTQTIKHQFRDEKYKEKIELKMYEHHFYKDAWEELDRLIEAA
jgi:hypothetical protein